MADRLDLRKHIIFNTVVSQAVYDDIRKLWLVSCHNVKDDKQTTILIECERIVLARGPLSSPKIPIIEGIYI